MKKPKVHMVDSDGSGTCYHVRCNGYAWQKVAFTNNIKYVTCKRCLKLRERERRGK